jgi:hypothetical protein
MSGIGLTRLGAGLYDGAKQSTHFNVTIGTLRICGFLAWTIIDTNAKLFDTSPWSDQKMFHVRQSLIVWL